MKFLIAFALAVACVHADVSHVVHQHGDEAHAEVLKFDSDVKPEGYDYAYETSNGIAASAHAIVNNANSENAAQSVEGQYSYTGPDGVTYRITYVANENGYQPQGDHLPVGPAIPEAILRSLEYIRAHPSEDKYSERTVPTAHASASYVNKPVNKPVNKFGRF